MYWVRLAILAAFSLASAFLLRPASLTQQVAPMADQRSAAAAAPRERTLLFVGDVMLSRGVGAKMKVQGDWTYPFQKIADILRSVDLTFGNLECPISDVGRNQGHLFSFRADPNAIEGLRYAGFDVVSLANNHAYDWGQPALLDTLRRLRAAEILPVGAGANDLEAHYPLLVNLDGLRLAFLAYVNIEPQAAAAGIDRPGVAWLHPDRVLADIRFARPLADVLIVCPHWGVEYSSRPTREQVDLAHQMIEAGADLVVGSHPHVVQPIEAYRGSWIAYSLGNFVFDQKRPATHRGLLLKVTLRGKQISDLTPIPISINRVFQAALASSEEKPALAARGGRSPDAGPAE